MSAEPYADDGIVRHLSAVEPVPETEPRDRVRPNVSGDLATVFHAGPMFRRAVAGYDRFQVDSYVRWAEDELATADSEREHLLARHLRAQAALEEARQLLSHSSGGGEFLGVSRRIGSMLAAAADEAESMRAEAEADRSLASAQAERTVADAERVLADAEVAAGRLIAEATIRAEEMTAEAGRIVAEAEQAGRDARAESVARLAEVRAIEQRAAEHAAQIRRQAMDEAMGARVQAREDVVRMLSTGREERRRADDEAAGIRERQDRDTAARRSALVAEVADLERRQAALRAELDRAAEPVAASSATSYLHVRGYLRRVRSRLLWQVAPWRSAPRPSPAVGASHGGSTDA
jgi:cell division septum initiation protein DivIVA